MPRGASALMEADRELRFPSRAGREWSPEAIIDFGRYAVQGAVAGDHSSVARYGWQGFKGGGVREQVDQAQ